MKIDKKALDAIKKISDNNDRILTLLHCFRIAYTAEGESSYVNPEIMLDLIMESAQKNEQLLYDSFLDDDIVPSILQEE